MKIFPAIDIKDKKCVRLIKGDFSQKTEYQMSPVEQATQFIDKGFKNLHIVDLDGAFAGHSVNLEAVNSILEAVDVPIQLGGGIRDIKQVEFWIDQGVSRIILGTAALMNPDFVKQSCAAFPGKIVVGIDALKGHVAVNGWSENTKITSVELAKRFEDSGVSSIIFTDIDRDGAMQGVNMDATLELSLATSIPVIASGGVSSIKDLQLLKERASENIEGVICGRALYNGAIDLKEALKTLNS